MRDDSRGGSRPDHVPASHPPGASALAVEDRYRGLFDECPVSLWEEDVSELLAHLDRLRASGVADLRAHFAANPGEIARCAGMVRVVSVNKATLELYEAPDEASLLQGLHAVFTEESLPAFLELLLACAEGRRRFEIEGVNRTLGGRRLELHLRWSLLPDQEGRLTRALLSATDLTARKQAERELRERETRYRAVTETAADGFWVVDRDGRLLEVNDAYLRRSGYSREELLSMRIQDLEAKEQPEDTASHVAKIVREGSDLFETLHRTKDRTVWQVEINASYWPIAGGRFFCFLRDIGRRKRSEALLRLRMELAGIAEIGSVDDLLRHALDTAELLTGSSVGFFHFVDEDQESLTLQAWSTNTLRDACSASAMGKHYPISQAGIWVDCFRTRAPVVHEGYATLPRRRGTPEGHVPIERELTIPVIHGGLVWAIAGVGNKSGAYTAEDVEAFQEIAAIVKDVVLRRQAEEWRKLLRHSIDAASDSAYWLDREGRFVFANAAGCASLGYLPEELSRLRVFDVNPAVTPARWEALWRDIAERKSLTAVSSHRRKDGSVFPVEVTSTYLKFGEHEYLTGFARDITQRKKAEDELWESRFMLAQVLDALPQSVFWKDRDGAYLGCNKVFARAVGLDDPARIAGKTDFDLPWPRAEAEAYRRDDREVIEGNRPKRHIIEPLQQADGSRLWIDTTKVPLLDRQGSVTGVLGVYDDITDRRRAEERLRASEESLRKAEHFAQIGNWEWHIATGEITWSEEVYRLYGLDPASGVPSFDLVVQTLTPDCRDRFVRAVEDAVKRGLPFDGEYRMRSLDGTLRHTHTRGEVARDERGEPVSMFGIMQDITERKAIEGRLRESEEKYRMLVEAANSVILTWDTEGSIVFINRYGEHFFGFAREELVGRNVVGTIVPETESSGRDLARLMESIRRDPDRFMDNENENVTKDGRRVWIRWANKAITGEDGALTGILSLGYDITERKLAEARLRRSEEFVRRILDTVDEGFIVVDRDFRILMANKAYAEQVGMPGDQIVGRPCHVVSHGSPHPCHESGEACAVRQVFLTGKPASSTHRHAAAGGATMFVETKGFPLLDGDGTLIAAIETVSNITERHLLEEERLKTQKLESIGTLAGGIAHDFNNLLQGVFGYLSMAKTSLGQRDRCLTMLEQAEKALHLSVNLTSQLLTFSKGGRPIKRICAVAPVVESAARFALSGSRSEARFDFPADLWQVDADEGQIGQVVQNIVLNADQAMPLGGRVSVAARNLPSSDAARTAGLEGRDYVEITIRDQGVGIPPQYLDRIFDPYFTTKEKGSGLGLATSYSIVRNHDGRIEVASTPGEGTAFTVFLPAVAAAATTPPSAPEEASPRARAGRVLVMDDDEVVREVAGELLRALGHEVEFAVHGEEAVARYGEAQAAGRPFDVVILDLTIRGGLGGAETVRLLRDRDPGVKAVVSSGYSDGSVAATFRESGFRAFLKKPYRLEDLRRTLDALLD